MEFGETNKFKQALCGARKMKSIYFLLFATLISIIFCKYSTKTAYMNSFTQKQVEFIQNPENYLVNQCEPEQIYILLRHGSRYPSTKQVDKSKLFVENVREYRKKQAEANDGQEPLRTAVDDVEVTFENEPHYRLSELGASEMHDIARRFKHRYPSIFNSSGVLSPIEKAKTKINIISSDRDRSIQSGHHFLIGLYKNEEFSIDDIEDLENIDVEKVKEERRNEKIAEFLNDHIDVNNRMMRLFDDCQTYSVGIKKNESAYEELVKFKNGPEMKLLIENMKKRLNLEELEINPSLVLKLFTLCNIESAHGMKENWCKLFEKEDYDVLAYLNDLKGYWMKSFGHKINSKMIFLVLKDLFAEMDKFISNDTKKHKILLRFGHAENIFPLVAALNLFNDPNGLRADNFKENLNRRFKSAALTPFSSNVAFVLHRCDGYNPATQAPPPTPAPTDDNESTNNSNILDEKVYSNYKIHVLVNELPVSEINAGELLCNLKDKAKLDETYINDGSICNYLDLKEQLSDYLDDEYEEVCQIKEDEAAETDNNGEIKINDALNVNNNVKIKVDL